MGIIKEEYRNFFSSTEELKEDLKTKGIPIGEHIDFYVASGGYGDVYATKSKNKVLKIHENEFEFESTQKIIDSKKKFDNVVNFYFNRKYGNYYISVMEMLDTPPVKFNPYISKALNIISSNLVADFEILSNITKQLVGTIGDKKRFSLMSENIAELYPKDISRVIITSAIKIKTKFSTESSVFEVLSFCEKNVDVMMDIINGVQELHSIGIENEDFHSRNIMYDPKTQKYKIIDIMD